MRVGECSKNAAVGEMDRIARPGAAVLELCKPSTGRREAVDNVHGPPHRGARYAGGCAKAARDLRAPIARRDLRHPATNEKEP